MHIRWTSALAGTVCFSPSLLVGTQSPDKAAASAAEGAYETVSSVVAIFA